ncbi:hypothetical protein BOX15_Mlig016923g2, partial [Macrostomum lignano]
VVMSRELQLSTSAASVASEWRFDSFDNGSRKEAGLVQIKRFSTFLQQHLQKSWEISTAIGHASEVPDTFIDPVLLNFSPLEHTNIRELANTDNVNFNKVALTLAYLIKEMKFLAAEGRDTHLRPFACYGEPSVDESASGRDPAAHSWNRMARMLPLFQDLVSFKRRCEETVRHTVQQLACLYDASKSRAGLPDMTGIKLSPVFSALCELLGCLISLDELLSSPNSTGVIQEDWSVFKKLVTAVKHDPAKYSFDIGQVKSFEKILMSLQGELLDSSIFQSCAEQLFDDSGIAVSKNSRLAEEFLSSIRSIFQQLDARIESNQAVETNERSRYIGLCGLYVLYFNIFHSMDKNTLKELWGLHKRLPAVYIAGNVLFYPCEFLYTKLSPHVKKLLDTKALSAVADHRRSWLADRDSSMTRDAQALLSLVQSWSARMEGSFRRADSVAGDLNVKASLLLEGLSLAFRLRHLVTTVLTLHSRTQTRVTKPCLLAMFRMIELLKVIQSVYQRRTVFLASNFSNVQQHFSYAAHQALHAAKKRLIGSTDRHYSQRKLDLLSAIILAENCLNGPPTQDRLCLVQLGLCMANTGKTFRDDELSLLSSTLRKLELVASLDTLIAEATDCAFLIWHGQRPVLQIHLADLYTGGQDVNRVHYLFAALADASRFLLGARHAASPSGVVEAFESECLSAARESVVAPLCRDVETDLRLQIHAHLQLDDRNPLRVGRRDLVHLLTCRPIRTFQTYLNLKAEVEAYLDRTFYNLTTVALHDWRTYAEMKSLAQQQYRLYLIEPHLPSQQLEQGLDVLEIMRNINVFVAKYLYNLNNQIFVEKASNNKHLNTINIRHVANSIRTHGTGIMNTTVNYTYQYLRKKFFIFSQFMFDEHIKARLIKDRRHFLENHVEGGAKDQMFPFERADKFNKGIRQLGVTDEGLTFLDHFRLLITQIGNAMGYVRMIRSGGLNCCSSAIRFVPDLEDIPAFEELASKAGLSQGTVTAAQQLDQTVAGLVKNYSEGTDYFAMLVDVFAKEFRDKKNAHLRNVHVIVPALTVNFVEHMVQCKDRLNKKNKTGAAFSDDGFAMGLAYVLKLLDQSREFDSLHWFRSVQRHYGTLKAQAKQQLDKAGRSDEKLQQTLTLTLSRHERYSREFALLDQGLTSARIFFRAEKEGGGGGGSGGSGGAGDSAAAAPTSAETAEATPAAAS